MYECVCVCVLVIGWGIWGTGTFNIMKTGGEMVFGSLTTTKFLYLRKKCILLPRMPSVRYIDCPFFFGAKMSAREMALPSSKTLAHKIISARGKFSSVNSRWQFTVYVHPHSIDM